MKWQQKINFYLAVLIIFLVLGVVFLLFLQIFKKEFNHIKSDYNIENKLSFDGINSESTKGIKNNLEKEKISTIFLAGDIMLDRGVEKSILNNNADYNFPFNFVKDEIIKHDLAFANLEGSISDVGFDLGNKYSFRFEPISALALKNSGFDVVSLANNHIWDWGKDSLCKSQDSLIQYGITGIGAGCNETLANQPFIYVLPNGIKVGILAYTNLYPVSLISRGDNPGVSKNNQESIISKITDLKQKEQVDIVLVSYHWGDEYKTRSNQSQQKIGRELIEAGADIIVGHHPHVVQEIERYQDGWIIYSLGNFIFDQYFSPETMSGIAVIAEVWDDGKILLNPKSFTLNKNYQPVFD